MTGKWKWFFFICIVFLICMAATASDLRYIIIKLAGQLTVDFIEHFVLANTVGLCGAAENLTRDQGLARRKCLIPVAQLTYKNCSRLFVKI